MTVRVGITDDMIEAGARVVPGGVDWDSLASSTQEYSRSMARDVLTAALAGRTVVELPASDGHTDNYDGRTVDPHPRQHRRRPARPPADPLAGVRRQPHRRRAEEEAGGLLAAAHLTRQLAETDVDGESRG